LAEPSGNSQSGGAGANDQTGVSLVIVLVKECYLIC
jgi:hypothetical protein